MRVTEANMVQFQSVKDNTFTLRDRDSTEQVRASLDEITKAISALVNGTEHWSNVAARLPKFEGQEVE
jgi:glycyl-tRNA synthetase